MARDPGDLTAAVADGLLTVRVTPRAASERIVIEDGVRVYVTAPPEGGKANAAVQKLLARALGRPKSAVVLIRGETARTKTFRID